MMRMGIGAGRPFALDHRGVPTPQCKGGTMMTEAGSKREPDSIDARVGRRIRERRRHLRISQVQLAATLGLSHHQLQKYEQGVNRLAATPGGDRGGARCPTRLLLRDSGVGPDASRFRTRMPCRRSGGQRSSERPGAGHSRGHAGSGRRGARAPTGRRPRRRRT